MPEGNQREIQTSSKASDAPDCSDAPSYRDRDALAAAYEAAGGSLKATAAEFDACYTTVRNHLIDAGIHEPQERPEMSTAARLESADPEEFGLSPLQEGV